MTAQAKQKRRFIDYKALKARITLLDVLNYYHLIEQLTQAKDDQLRGRCPIHKGNDDRQFTVNTSRNVWNCFSPECGGGNILDLVAGMEDTDLMGAAHLLVEWFPEDTPQRPAEAMQEPDTVTEAKEATGAPETLRENPVLKLELKHLDSEHEMITKMGFQPTTAEYFGAGYCTRGIMAKRIAIPINNGSHALVGYAGYDPDSDDYKYPTKYGFITGIDLYNLTLAVNCGEPHLIIVPDITDVWHLHECGIHNAVALMGYEMSYEQRDALFRSGVNNVQVLFPNSEKIARINVASLLLASFYVRVNQPPTDQSIREMDVDTLRCVCSVH